MTIQIERVHAKSFRGSPQFRYAQISGTGHNSDHASWYTFDDEQIVRDRWWDIRPGQTVLDVGAAFGSYALPALALGARVVCFSPADFDTELLQTNLGLNPELSRRCLVVRDGLHGEDGWFNPDKAAFSHGIDDEQPELKKQWLRVRTLDAFLLDRPGIGRVHWLKLDVEGAELGVLRGGEQCLRSDRPSILIENHEQHVPGIAEQVRAYLASLNVGYTCEGPIQHGVVSHSLFRAR